MGVQFLYIGVGRVLIVGTGTNKVADNKSKTAKNFNVLLPSYFQRSSRLVWKERKSVAKIIVIHCLKLRLSQTCSKSRRGKLPHRTPWYKEVSCSSLNEFHYVPDTIDQGSYHVYMACPINVLHLID